MPKPLHLAAWNLNHRTGRKAIPPAVIHAIATLDIDVLVLTEFVDGDHHARFKDCLNDIGFESVAVSVKAPRQNQVLIAARSRTRRRRPAAAARPHRSRHHQLAAPTPARAAPRSRGLARPDVPRPPTTAPATGARSKSIARAARDRHVIFLGDFRCDPHTQTRLATRVPATAARRLHARATEGRLELPRRRRQGRHPRRSRNREPRLTFLEANTSTRRAVTLAGPVHGHAPGNGARSPTTRCSRSSWSVR